MLFLVASCNKDTALRYTVKGNADNIESGIIVFGLDRRYQKADSIIADKKGNFSYSIECDTITPLMMIMADGKQVTLFAEPGVKAELAYSCLEQKCVVKGGPTQMLHDSITQIIEACPNDKKRVEEIEDFIEEYPISEVNIELLRRYMINVPEPDYQQIKTMISKLGGILQDNEYIALTKKNIESRNGNSLHKQFPSFSYYTADSCKNVTLNTFNKKHLLITLWASWNEESRKELELLHRIDTIVKSENFAILNIAFDHDTTEWKKCVTNDSIIGYNVCEKDAWSSELANKFNIRSLPYSILVNPYQRIVRTDVDLEEDVELIDSLVTKHDKSLKEREEREKKKEKEKEKEKKKKGKKR